MRETFYRQVCLGVPPVTSFRKKMGKNSFPTETLANFWPFWWPVDGGDKFSPLTPTLGLILKLIMSPSFTVHGGEHDTEICNNRIDDARGICEGDKFRRLV